MLRPATPVSVLLGVAFVLLLLSVLSTPIIHAIPLGSYKDVTFGFLGYCSDLGCSPLGLGYGDIEKISPGDSQAFNFGPTIRNTLSTILVLHPVGAFLTLITFIMAVAAHLRVTSHSTRYLLIFFILLVLDFLVCIGAFIVDILLFLPHQAWGAYIVLVATILVLVCGVGSCVMRRRLIRRKAFRTKSEDNANINSSDFYGIQPPKPSYVTNSQPTVPVLSGANGSPDTLPAFTTYEHDRKDDRMSDEQIPLTLRSTPDRSTPSMSRSYDEMPGPGTAGVTMGGRGPNRSRSQDQYLNQTPVNSDHRGNPKASSYEHMNRGGRRGPDQPANYRGNNPGYTPPYMRGRGGYGPRGGPGFGPRGGGRGGYGPPPRGAYGSMLRGGGRAPPPGHMNMAEPHNRRPQPEQQAPYRTQSPLASDPSAGQDRAIGNGGYRPYLPSINLPRAESPPPLPGDLPETNSNHPMAHPIEMDVSPISPIDDSDSPDSYNQAGDRDTKVSASTALQEDRIPEHPELENTHPEVQYVPVRTAWNLDSDARGPSPAGSRIPSSLYPGRTQSASPAQGGEYYEDVDPQFDQTHNHQTHPQQPEDSEIMRNRSPADSERSNYDSISQRGINPQWNARPAMLQPSYGGPSRQPMQQRQDLLLNNPDFKVPGGRPGASGQRGMGGMTPGSAYPPGSL